jgi:hypothetical protein
MKYIVRFETKIELDEDNIHWTEAGAKEFFGPYTDSNNSLKQPMVNLSHPDLRTDWESRYLTECLLAVNSAAAGGDLQGVLSFGTARVHPNHGEPVDYADTSEFADAVFHEVYGTIEYSVVEELHFGDNPVEGA